MRTPPTKTPPFLTLTPRQLDELASLLAWLADSPFNAIEDFPGPGWDREDAWDPDDVVTLAEAVA